MRWDLRSEDIAPTPATPPLSPDIAMRAIGTFIFDENAAVDLAIRVEQSGFAEIRRALSAVVNASETDYVEIDECLEAVAAAAIIAAARGHAIDALPEELQPLLRSYRKECRASDVHDAIAAIQRVQTSSELKELWQGDSTREAALSELTKLLVAKPIPLARPQRPAKRISVDEGDIVVIPLRENTFAIAKVLFLSGHWKDVMLIGVFPGTTDRAGILADWPDRFRFLIYTSSQIIKKGIWSRVGHVALRESERDVSLRRIADRVWLRDEVLRTATEADRKTIPVMLVRGLKGVEQDLRHALEL